MIFEARDVKPGMVLVHNANTTEHTVVQNAKVNQVLVLRDTDGEIWYARYPDYQQPVLIREGPHPREAWQ